MYKITLTTEDKIITIEEYAKLIGYKKKNPTLQKVQQYAEEYLDVTLWDYPLEEQDYVLKEVSAETVRVRTKTGIRICELL